MPLSGDIASAEWNIGTAVRTRSVALAAVILLVGVLSSPVTAQYNPPGFGPGARIRLADTTRSSRPVNGRLLRVTSDSLFLRICMTLHPWDTRSIT
ncbi:MAG: hypothetical protein H7Z74_07045 [Anaerolineae bacterium]|nr:hypothetical protein [Gemmatimonadaceae bacterium]